MSQLSRFTVIAPTTLAVTSNAFDAQSYDVIDVGADALAGAETVTLQFVAGVTAKQVSLLDGTPVNLTASLAGVALEGGAQYVFVKSVTASPCGVYVYPKIL